MLLKYINEKRHEDQRMQEGHGNSGGAVEIHNSGGRIC